MHRREQVVDREPPRLLSRAFIAGHHVMARTRSARRHRQGPQAAQMRGRSGATSLARCRAQIEHRLRDGQRTQRGHDCWTRRLPRKRRHSTPLRLHHRGAEQVQFGDQNVPPERDGLSGRSGSLQRANVDLTRSRFRDRRQPPTRPTQDTDSHGVSDPSGHTRGHFHSRAPGSLTPCFLL